MPRQNGRLEQEVLTHIARMRGAATATSPLRRDVSLHRRRGTGHDRRQSLSRRPAASAVRREPRDVQAECPGCHTVNEFTAPATCPERVTVRCFSCSEVFGVRVPPPEHWRPTDVRVCRNCGEMNHISSTDTGSPRPDMQCGSCGHVLPRHGDVSQWSRDPVSGQRQQVPLRLLAAAMIQDAQRRRNPAAKDAASEADIAALPVQRVTGDASHLGEQSCCTICLEDFKAGDDVKTLPCLHLYHMSCIDSWLRRSNDCPICKTCIGKDCCGGDSCFHASSK